MYKYIKKDKLFLTDYIYMLNHLPVKECKKTVRVSPSMYHALVISGYFKDNR